jgi:Uma2 family endonuclease
VIEVLSPSTEGTDRREKLFAYQGIASLRAYLIVHQDERRVERYWRAATGPWRQEDIAGDAAVPIPCLDFDLSLADIYEGVRFDES